ncbi:MAG: DUF2339 domain-containing protein, partial [Pseudomonadota bacterium]
MFELLAFALAVVALIIARKGQTQIAELRARLDALAAGQPLPATPEAGTAPAAAIGEAPLAPDAELAPELAATAAPAASGPAPEATAEAAAKPGFEERIGTRWVVWVGGLTLALGGFFMVRYSIEQGLLGPGVRVLLGGLFALALLIAGEWTRRKESVVQLAALPIANIPAILTAAGTAVAFATVYAAYALYDFLVPATAFILLG